MSIKTIIITMWIFFYYWWGGTESLGIYLMSLVLWPLWPIVQTPMIDEDDFWSNWWNEIWQGKLNYLEKTYRSATLSTTISHMTDLVSNPGPQWWEASD
jgi:hypothetical protein